MKRDQRKHTREAMDQAAHEAALLALKDNNWVLMANTLYGPKGQAMLPLPFRLMITCAVIAVPFT